MSCAPIGIFDSGIGGLTVFSALRALLPHEPLLYLGDTARVPYGAKSADTVLRYSRQNARFLLQRGVKCIVVACNTASALALEMLSAECPVPVIGVVQPGAAAAARVTRNQRVGVIGTRATIASDAYGHALRSLLPDATVISRACPLFVPLVEEGWGEHPATMHIAHTYLDELVATDIDTLVLGCTHYPLLAPLIQRVMGPQVSLIDSARAVAGAVQVQLQTQHACASDTTAPSLQLCVTDMPQHFADIAGRFFGTHAPSVEVVDLI